jgi:hypothetical protein
MTRKDESENSSEFPESETNFTAEFGEIQDNNWKDDTSAMTDERWKGDDWTENSSGNSKEEMVDKYDESRTSPKSDEEKKFEIHFGLPGVTGLSFLRGFAQGAVIGGVFGGLKGVVDGIRHQNTPGSAPLLTYVARESIMSSKSFGLWLGTYQSAVTYLRGIRHTHDSKNAMFAGFCAGTISSLHTRSIPQIAYAGISSGAMMAVMFSMGNRV